MKHFKPQKALRTDHGTCFYCGQDWDCHDEQCCEYHQACCEIDKLKEENKKLRKCVEFYAKNSIELSKRIKELEVKLVQAYEVIRHDRCSCLGNENAGRKCDSCSHIDHIITNQMKEGE